jgi:hypothetical protein
VVTTPPPPRISPEQHLADAERVLSGVSDKSLPSAARRNLAQLRKDFESLTKSFKGNELKVSVWQPAMYDTERDLVLLVGGGGIDTIETKAIPGLAAQVAEPLTREGLETFRTHLELFYDVATALPPQMISAGSAPVQ